MPRSSSSAPLNKTFHFYYSKLKRSITTVPPSPFTIKRYNSSPGPPSNSLSPDFASDTEPNAIPPDLATVSASCHQRFFFTSPGRSNSIYESRCSTIIQDQETKNTLLITGAIPIQTYSPNPFIDFRRSMQQMVEANDILDVRADHYRNYMHELLLGYLALNTKDNHRFIVQAFVDLLISLVTSPPGYRCSTSSASN